jgi:lysophospholipid acyltransferase (LPLAT)-like uncharacterized protein
MLNWLKMSLVPPIGEAVIRLLGRALRLQAEGTEHVDTLYRQGARMIIAFWHDQQLMMPLAYRGTEAHVLISQHRDGELIHRIAGRFGLRSVRGSTTRGGTAALRQLIRLGRAKVDVVVTPDGPRGPRHVAQAGVVQLAKATGLPIVPLAFSCSKKKSFPAGIGSSFHIPAAVDCSSGASQFTSRPTPRWRTWKRSVWKWRWL